MLSGAFLEKLKKELSNVPLGLREKRRVVGLGEMWVARYKIPPSESDEDGLKFDYLFSLEIREEAYFFHRRLTDIG